MESTLPIIGLVKERKCLIEALRNRDSLLVTGPQGSGKTRILQAAVHDLADGIDVVYVAYSPNLHLLLVTLTRTLLESGHRTLQRLAPAWPDPDRWLSRQTSIHLKGILWKALETEPRTIILDGVDGGSYPIYRFIQRIYFAKGMAVFAASRNPAGMGPVGRLFWDPKRSLQIRPLTPSESEELFDLAAKQAGLYSLDVDLHEFRVRVLEAADGNPRQIVEMCRLAVRPQYLAGKYIKFAPLRIDAMLRFLQ
jgi:hypothetical protein